MHLMLSYDAYYCTFHKATPAVAHWYLALIRNIEGVMTRKSHSHVFNRGALELHYDIGIQRSFKI